MAVFPIRPAPAPQKAMSDAEQRAYDRGMANGYRNGKDEGAFTATVTTLAIVAGLIGSFFLGSWLG